MKLADYIKARRAELGLSLSQLAARCGLSKGCVWQMEQGQSKDPTCAVVVSLAGGLQIGAVALFKIVTELE